MRLLFKFFLFIPLLHAALSQAQVDPSLNWRVLETPHFEVIFSESYEDLAQIYAEEAEQSLTTLKPLFQEITEKTIVVILDNTDSTNGYANFLPYAHVVIFPVMPHETSSIGHFDDWARDLFLHEYAHILTFQPSHGLYTPLRWIFGTIIRPNALLPRWFLEGLAVQVESRYTPKGRLRSAESNGLLRAMVRDNTLLAQDLSTVNEVNTPRYPFGQRPYLLGGLLWQEMLSSSQPGLTERLLQRHSRRLPFLLNGAIEDETKGLNYEALLQRAYLKQKDLRTRELQVLNSPQNPQKKMLFSQPHKGQSSPRISPDGRYLIFVQSDPKEGSSVNLVAKAAQETRSFKDLKSRNLFSTTGTTTLSWLGDSESFVYDKIETYQHYSQYSDLYLFNLKSNETRRLTSGARAREPSVSPDGKHLVYVGLVSSRTQLHILDLRTRETRFIYDSPQLFRMSAPFWLDTQHVAFTVRNRKGQTGLYKIDIRNPKRPQRLLASFQHISQPKLTSRGLLFASTDSGVSNLYLSQAPHVTATPITRSETHIYHGDIDPQSGHLIFSEITGVGPQLFLQAEVKPQSLPFLSSAVVEDLAPLTASPDSAAASRMSFQQSDYQGLRYLRPRYWVPFVFPIEGGAIFQGTVQTNDPLLHHSYFLSGSFDTVTEKTAYSIGYLNQTTPVSVALSTSEFQNFLPGANLTLTNRYHSAELGGYLSSQSNWRGSVLYVYDEMISTARSLRGTGPGIATQWVSKAKAGRGAPQAATALRHIEFLKSGDNYTFGKTTGSLQLASSLFLSGSHNFSWTTRASHSPEMRLSDSILLGDKTIGGNFLVNIINSSFVMRGYPTGAFVGRSLINTSFEYQFPLLDIYKGWGTFPLYLQNMSGLIFAEGVGVDGGYFDPELEVYRASPIEDSFWSTGFELRWNATAGYHLPITFIFGMYYGFNPSAGGGLTPFISLGYTGHGGVDQTTNP